MRTMLSKKKNVLVAVIRSRRDRDALMKKRWYRIPVLHMPKKKFTHIAFYQPAVFGKKGKRIAYYARVRKTKIVKRVALLPDEKYHPRAHDDYVYCGLGKIQKLDQPIKNIIPRRISFGFTDLKTLLSARDVLELYGVLPTEQIVEKRLKQFGITSIPEFTISLCGRRFRIDLAIFCPNGKIAVECDNKKAHASKAQKIKDAVKNSCLRRNDWRVIRLKERDIVEHLDCCILRIKKVVASPVKRPSSYLIEGAG